MIASGLFALALAVRLMFLFSSPDRDWPHSIFYEGDAPLWVEWAAALDDDRAFEFNLPIHPPGVAYALHGFYSGTRTADFVALKILWCAISAAGCAMLYLSCCAPVGRRTAIIAALLCTFSFGQYLLATSLNSETPYVLLLPTLVWLTQRWLKGGGRWLIVIIGALHGLALLLRPEHPLLVLLWCAWLFARRMRDADDAQAFLVRAKNAVAPVLIMIGAMLLVLLPWSVRANLAVRTFNRVVAPADVVDFTTAPVAWSADGKSALNDLPAFARFENFRFLNHIAAQRGLSQIDSAAVRDILLDEFGYVPEPLSARVLVSNQGGFSFALANHPQSDGGFTRHALAHQMVGGDPKFAFAFPPHLRLMNDGFEVGWQYIRNDFSGWLRLVGMKMQRFCAGATLGYGASNAPLGRTGVRHPVDLMTAKPGTGLWWKSLILCAIGAGTILALVRRRAGIWLMIIVYKLIVTALFYGYARQAVSIGPAFFVMIALAVDAVMSLLARRGAWRDSWHPAVAAIVIAAMAIHEAMVVLNPAQVSASGNLLFRPEWGTDAFTSFGRVELTDSASAATAPAAAKP